MPIQGTVPVGGSFAPTDSADSFGTHNDKWGIGGHRVVKTITARNGIPVNESGLLNLDDELASGRRKLGMFVYVSDEDKFYILKVDQVTWDGYNEGQKVAALAEDDNWVEFVGGGGDTGNIGFENNWIKNTVGEEIYISPQDGYTWLWLPSDTNAAAGDYVNLANTHPDGGGVYITTNAGSWQFKNDGILQAPGRISFGGIDWQSIGVGNVNSHGGSYGISLYCTVGYELNWQAGYLAARDYLSPYDIIDIRSDSLIKYTTPPDYTIFHATFDDDTLITKKYLEDKGYLTSFTESDPVFSGSAAFGITSTQITNWDTAYGWGNHANAGYLTDAPSDGKTYGRKNATWSEVVTTGGGIPKGTASGTDTYTVTITGVAAYNDGDAYLIRFPNGNTTSATLNINSLGARDLFRNNDGPLIGGDIFSGGEMLCIYNSALNGFQCIGSSPNSLFAYVTNGETSTISKGQVVYAFSGTGDRMVVKLASNSGDATSAKTVGVVYSTSIGANQKGIILMQGLMDGLSILGSPFVDGDSVYLGSTAGSITRTKPSAPNHLVYVATVTTASNGNAGRMYVKIQNGYELDEIHDVAISSPATGHYLYYDATTDPAKPVWKNSASWQGTEIPISKGGTGATTDSGARTNLGLAIGTNVQAYSANLAAIAALSPTLDNFIVGNGTTWILETPSQARTSIGLGNVENTALSTWAGSTNITTLGTISSGTWNGSTIAVARGGTGLTTIAARSILVANTLDTYTTLTPGAGQSVRINAGGTAWEVFTPGAAGTINLNSITAATGAATINNSANQITWAWNTLTTGVGGFVVTSSSVSSGAVMSITSTSTAAASSSQRTLSVSASGVNANSSQSTIALDSSNTHTGTGALNIAGRFISTGGSTNIPISIDNATGADGLIDGLALVYSSGSANGNGLSLTWYFNNAYNTPVGRIANIRSGVGAYDFTFSTWQGSLSEVMRLTAGTRVGIGTGSIVSAKLHTIATTEQLRLGYDASNYLSVTVGITGGVTLDAVGSGAGFTFSDSLTLSANISIATATTGTGGMIGTSTSQLVGFHGVAGTAQRAAAAQAAVATTAATQTTPWGYSTAAQADGIVTLLNEIRTVLVNKGLMKGSA